MVEHSAVNRRVASSNLARGANFSFFLSYLQTAIVFQFPYFNRAVFHDRETFLQRLMPFLRKLLKDQKFAIELRNKDWLDGGLTSALTQFGVALVLQDRSWMDDPIKFRFDPVTADFAYISWLGNRKLIEATLRAVRALESDLIRRIRPNLEPAVKTAVPMTKQMAA